MQKPDRSNFATDALYALALDAFITYSLSKIFDQLISEQKPMDAQIANVLMDNLWDLYAD